MADLHNITSPIAKANAAEPAATENDVVGLSVDLLSRLRVIAVSGGGAAATATETAVTAGVSSTTWLAASSTRKFLQIKNESATASVAYRVDGGTAALNTAGSVTLGPGGSATYDSFVPSGAVTGIASLASTPVTVISA